MKPGAVQSLPEGYEVLHRGPVRDIVINSNIWAKIRKSANEEQRAELADLFRRYGECGWDKMPKSKFNVQEGTYTGQTGARVRLEAFKPWQRRVYGFCQQFN